MPSAVAGQPTETNVWAATINFDWVISDFYRTPWGRSFGIGALAIWPGADSWNLAGDAGLAAGTVTADY